MLAPAAIATIGPAVALVAESANNSGFDPYSLIGTLVTPVLVVVLLLTNKLHTEGDYKRLAADLDVEKSRTTTLQNALTDRVIPALTRSTLVLETVSPLLQTEVHLREFRNRTELPPDV